MICVNDFSGLTDNEIIESAIAHRGADGIVVIPPRQSAVEPERTTWLLDRAILLPENTTVILRNATIKLSDRCRDNFFRTANCGLGIEEAERIQNVHLIGEGLSTLVGADHPRATGDGSKILACPCPYTPEEVATLADWVPEERRAPEKLDFGDMHNHSYGTDANAEGESHMGDWRGIGVLFANAEHFSIENIRIVKSHGWGISLEACSYGRILRIEFDANMSKEIDGMLSNMENQDGIDLRNGCHHIVVSDVTGRTGDDVIALTAIANPEYLPGGSLETTHVLHNDWSRREADIHDIVVRNVIAYSHLCWVIRLLSCNCRIYNVVIDGVIDCPPEGLKHAGTLLIGEGDGGYGRNLPDGVRNVTVSNVVARSGRAVTIGGYLKDSAFMNIINDNPDEPVFTVHRKNGIENVHFSNISTRGELLVNTAEG